MVVVRHYPPKPAAKHFPTITDPDRIGELRRAEWVDIDLDRAESRFHASKTQTTESQRQQTSGAGRGHLRWRGGRSFKFDTTWSGERVALGSIANHVAEYCRMHDVVPDDAAGFLGAAQAVLPKNRQGNRSDSRTDNTLSQVAGLFTPCRDAAKISASTICHASRRGQ